MFTWVLVASSFIHGSYSCSNLSEGADRVGEQLRGDTCFFCLTSTGARRVDGQRGDKEVSKHGV